MNARGFSVMQRLPELVDAPNAYQPAFLASYPTMLSLLAEELRAGRLQITPALLWSGGEYLSIATASDIERTFDCPVINEYGASPSP
jgi:phenylacetate-coenzyme A ligase PaaK-like adenylate-forming protein